MAKMLVVNGFRECKSTRQAATRNEREVLGNNLFEDLLEVARKNPRWFKLEAGVRKPQSVVGIFLSRNSELSDIVLRPIIDRVIAEL